jgi:hypothetical protein
MQPCDKHDSTMDRIFTSIHCIQSDQKLIQEQIQSITKFADDIHKIVYGNGQEGIVSKVRRVLSQLNLQWGLIILLIGAFIGYAFKLLAK